jgi:hypothetical protein
MRNLQGKELNTTAGPGAELYRKAEPQLFHHISTTFVDATLSLVAPVGADLVVDVGGHGAEVNDTGVAEGNGLARAVAVTGEHD